MRVDIVTALCLIAMSVGAYIISLDFPEGANVFPQLLAYAVGILAAIVLVFDLRKAREGTGPQKASKASPTRAYVTFALSVLYVMGIETIGFFVSSVAISVALMMYMGIRRVSTYALALSSMVLFYFLLFDRFLHVPLPHGLLY